MYSLYHNTDLRLDDDAQQDTTQLHKHKYSFPRQIINWQLKKEPAIRTKNDVFLHPSQTKRRIVILCPIFDFFSWSAESLIF